MMETWDGNGALRRYLVPVEELRPHPRNPRRGDTDAIVESLRRFGQQRPVVIAATGHVVAGNHTLAAAARLGWTHIAAVRSDLLDEQEIERYLVADNRTSDLAGYDNAELRALLEEQAALVGTGYTDDDLVMLRAAVEAAAAPPPERTASQLGLRMILRYDRDTYEAMIGRMDSLMKEWGADTYSAVVERAVTDAAAGS
jgi:hypothetical protein